MAKYQLKNRSMNITVEGEFETLRDKLSELTEQNKKVSLEEWESIQLISEDSLPIKVGPYRFSRMEGELKPILFNTEMVRAILEGRKTVTRRVAKGKILNSFVDVGFSDEAIKDIDNHLIDECKYKVGDVLYVRETFAYSHDPNDEYFVYKADGEPNYPYYGKELSSKKQWLPSIHMPKSAARIFLKVTDVRIERLQDITAEQCADEGIDIEGMDYRFEAVHEFSQLWNSTIKKSDLDQFGWEANPWVWVIEFEKCEKSAEVK